MGYYTSYKIVSIEPGDKVVALERAFSLHAVGRSGAANWFGVGAGSGKITWYEHEQHIADAMVESGVTKLVLHGEGEETGDVWDKTFILEPARSSGSFCLTPPRVTVELARYELVAKKPEDPKEIKISDPGWSKIAEEAARTTAAIGGRRRIPGCQSNECAIRNACIGHICCPGGLYRG